jgi:hypothetical protein
MDLPETQADARRSPMRSASWSSSWPGRTRVRTVGSHLDRIRDKTGRRRRADLTQLPLQAGLV